jgi:hypothetical protein
MFWKWFLGTGVKLGKLLQHRVLKTALVASVVKQLVQLTF